MIYETQEQAIAALKYWQGVLRLQDWNVELEILPKRFMPVDAHAANNITMSLKRSHIVLLDSKDLDHNGKFPLNHEEDLVHELLHLHFEPIRDMLKNDNGELDRPAHIAVEQAVELIATALVKLNNDAATQRFKVDISATTNPLLSGVWPVQENPETFIARQGPSWIRESGERVDN